MSDSPVGSQRTAGLLAERLEQLEQDVTREVRRVVESYQRQISERLREGSEELRRRIEDVIPELPGSFLAGFTPPAPEPAPRATADDLVAATARLDGERTQAGLVSALVEEALRFASRSAFFLTRPGEIRCWSSAGFDDAAGLGALRLDYSEAPWSELQSSSGVVRLGSVAAADLAARTGAAPAEDAVLVPFVVRGRLGGVLYADHGEEGALDVASLQLLAFTASLALETLAVRDGASPSLRSSGPGVAAVPLWEPSSERPPAPRAVAVPTPAAVEPAAVEAAAVEAAAVEAAAVEAAAVEPPAAVAEPTFAEPAEPAEPAGPAEPVAADAFELEEEPESLYEGAAATELPEPTFEEEPEDLYEEAAPAAADAFELVPETAAVEPAPEAPATFEPEPFAEEAPPPPFEMAPEPLELEPEPLEPAALEPAAVEPPASGAADVFDSSPGLSVSPPAEEPVWTLEEADESPLVDDDTQASMRSAAAPEITAPVPTVEEASPFDTASSVALPPPPAPPEVLGQATVRLDVAALRGQFPGLMPPEPEAAAPLFTVPSPPSPSPSPPAAEAPAFELEPEPEEAAAAAFEPEPPELEPVAPAAFEPPAPPVTEAVPALSASEDATLLVGRQPLPDVGVQPLPPSMAGPPPMAPPPATTPLAAPPPAAAPPAAPPPVAPPLAAQPVVAAPAPAAPPPSPPKAAEGEDETEVKVGTSEVRPPADVQGPGSAFRRRAGGPGGSVPEGEAALHEEARRLARLLVSEIKLYNEELIEIGRRDGNIYDRLKEDIDRSRQMYDERIDSRVRQSEIDYFYDELVHRLAGGNPALLGMGG